MANFPCAQASEVSLVILWCPEYEVSFGRVDLEEASSSSPAVPPPPLTYVGPFVETEHAVAGDVYVRDARTLVVRNFNYDGRGPSVVFFAGEEDSLVSSQTGEEEGTIESLSLSLFTGHRRGGAVSVPEVRRAVRPGEAEADR